MPSARLRDVFELEDDPLTRAIAPPENETPAECEARLRAERDAKRISDSIDDEIKQQRLAGKKGSKPIQILLLGQSESGKSTTLKNFQLMNSPKAFQAEKASWRAIIQLNVVRSIRLILDAMTDPENNVLPPAPSVLQSSSPVPASVPASVQAFEFPVLTADHLKLKMRLSPLLQVEEALLRKLVPPGSPVYEPSRFIQISNTPLADRPQSRPHELILHSAMQWKTAFNRFVTDESQRSSADSMTPVDWSDPSDPRIVLHACAEDMVRLWNDSTINNLLNVMDLRLEEMAGFFLNSLDRITSPDYVPTNDDILRARLKTLGVSEHRFTMKSAHSTATGEFLTWGDKGLCEVREHSQPSWSGSDRRTCTTAAWIPFFDDMNAIIFLAPINCFDQVLDEDPSVGRIEDSINLWKAVVSNPLLKETNIVLFLNKCDLLKAKLVSGVRFVDHIVSYGDRPNDFDHVSHYLRKKFAVIFKEQSPSPRQFYYHFTSVTDMKSTLHILANVQDMILSENLKKSSLA